MAIKDGGAIWLSKMVGLFGYQRWWGYLAINDGGAIWLSKVAAPFVPIEGPYSDPPPITKPHVADVLAERIPPPSLPPLPSPTNLELHHGLGRGQPLAPERDSRYLLNSPPPSCRHSTAFRISPTIGNYRQLSAIESLSALLFAATHLRMRGLGMD